MKLLAEAEIVREGGVGDLLPGDGIDEIGDVREGVSVLLGRVIFLCGRLAVDQNHHVGIPAQRDDAVAIDVDGGGPSAADRAYRLPMDPSYTFL